MTNAQAYSRALAHDNKEVLNSAISYLGKDR